MLKDDAIDELGAGFTHRFQTMQDAVYELGLVFEDVETLGADHCLVGIPESVLKAIPLSAGNQGRLPRVMQSRSIGLLRAFARELGCPFEDSAVFSWRATFASGCWIRII